MASTKRQNFSVTNFDQIYKRSSAVAQHWWTKRASEKCLNQEEK